MRIFIGRAGNTTTDMLGSIAGAIAETGGLEPNDDIAFEDGRGIVRNFEIHIIRKKRSYTP